MSYISDIGSPTISIRNKCWKVFLGVQKHKYQIYFLHSKFFVLLTAWICRSFFLYSCPPSAFFQQHVFKRILNLLWLNTTNYTTLCKSCQIVLPQTRPPFLLFRLLLGIILILFINYPNNPRFFTGGCSFIVLASSTIKSLCSLVSLLGV